MHQKERTLPEKSLAPLMRKKKMTFASAVVRNEESVFLPDPLFLYPCA